MEAERLVKGYEDLMAKHPGKWVAIHNNEVVASAESVVKLRETVEKLNDVFIGYSPTPREKKVGYLL